MTPKPRAWISWSGGKDSAWALHMARKSGEYEITGAITSINEKTDRVHVHNVSMHLLIEQMKSIQLTGNLLYLPDPCPNDVFEYKMLEILERARDEGVTHIIYGDISLDDVRGYRDKLIQKMGVTGVYPLWKQDTGPLASKMVNGGIKARISCVNLDFLKADFVGWNWGVEFLKAIPEYVDPLGENGEFHTFVYDGPMFNQSLNVLSGEIYERDGFAYSELK